MNIKKAAMFGLDARIALAIFGALSVISGAALYSAIQESKMVAIIAESSEISKAVEEYMLSVGEDLPLGSASYDIDCPEAFLSTTKTGWNGPYLSYSDPSDSRDRLKHSSYGYVSVQKYTDEANTSTTTPIFCSAGKTCYYWSVIWDVPLSLLNAIDDKYDDGVAGTGNIKVFYSGSGSPTIGNIAIKGPLLLNQP